MNSKQMYRNSGLQTTIRGRMRQYRQSGHMIGQTFSTVPSDKPRPSPRDSTSRRRKNNEQYHLAIAYILAQQALQTGKLTKAILLWARQHTQIDDAFRAAYRREIAVHTGAQHEGR